MHTVSKVAPCTLVADCSICAVLYLCRGLHRYVVVTNLTHAWRTPSFAAATDVVGDFREDNMDWWKRIIAILDTRLRQLRTQYDRRPKQPKAKHDEYALLTANITRYENVLQAMRAAAAAPHEGFTLMLGTRLELEKAMFRAAIQGESTLIQMHQSWETKCERRQA